MLGGVSIVSILARRFLLSKASDRFLSFIAWVSVVGVALGVLTLTVVTSVINGFEGELTHVITGMYGDVYLYTHSDAVNPGPIESRIRTLVPEMESITDSFVYELMASGPGGVAGAIVDGIDPLTIGKVTDIPNRVVSGRMPIVEGEVALASAIAERLGATEGTEIRLIAPFTLDQEGASDRNRMGAPKVMKARVVGIIQMGMYEYDSKFVFAPLNLVQDFLGQPGKVTNFNLKLKSGSDSRKISDRLADNFGYPFHAKDWAQLNKNLFYAIRLEKVVISILLTVIVVVAAFNVVSTLMMMIHDKAKEISILKAMGFRPAQSFKLFCIIGMGMGTVGAIVGVAIGLGLNWVIERTHMISLPADIYYIGFLPSVVRWSEVAMIAAGALVISFFATLYPALQVSRRSPLEGLRYE